MFVIKQPSQRQAFAISRVFRQEPYKHNHNGYIDVNIGSPLHDLHRCMRLKMSMPMSTLSAIRAGVTCLTPGNDFFETELIEYFRESRNGTKALSR